MDTVVQYSPATNPLGLTVAVKLSVFPLAVGVVMLNQVALPQPEEEDCAAVPRL
jgi:hypothetical protein